MALTNDANTPSRSGSNLSLPVAAATKIYAGALVAVNAAGDAVPAADTAGLKVVGRATSQVDNSAGAAGDLSITVDRKEAFRFANSSTNAITAAHLMSNALVEDDGTVASVSINSIVAGKIIDLDANGVWVEL